MQENQEHLFHQHRRLDIGLLGTFSQIGGVLQNVAQLPVKAAGPAVLWSLGRSRECCVAAPGSAGHTDTAGQAAEGQQLPDHGDTVQSQGQDTAPTGD